MDTFHAVVATPLCLGNIPKDCLIDNLKKKTGFTGYVYNFSVDYDAITVHDILNIHKYLMKNNNVLKCLGLLKTFFTGLTILSKVNLLTATPIRFISLTNQQCKVRPEIVNVNSDGPVFIL